VRNSSMLRHLPRSQTCAPNGSVSLLSMLRRALGGGRRLSAVFLLSAPARRDARDRRDHDACADQRVFANHVRGHSNSIARNESQQQCCRGGSHHAEDKINCGDRATVQGNIYRSLEHLSPNQRGHAIDLGSPDAARVPRPFLTRRGPGRSGGSVPTVPS
jgi:hypothetical protein